MESKLENIKEFKSFLKLPGGGEINRCYYPFKLDTYGCGCSNNCSYCYAKSVLHFRKLWDEARPSVANIQKIETIFDNVFNKGKNIKYSNVLRSRIPLRLGGMTDCFSDAEKEHKVTYGLLKILKKYEYPYLILTKNKIIASDEYLEVLDPNLAYVQFSITTPYDDVAQIYEEGASTTTERLQAASKLAQNGFYLAARVNPLFPIFPDGYFSKERQFLSGMAKSLRYFDWSLVDMIADAGFKTLIAGFLRLSSWNLRWIREKTGQDLTWLFDPKIRQKNSALHFGVEEKRYYYEKIQKLCNDRGVEFTVCYDGDEAYETFRYLWANQNDCCNGKGKVASFERAFDFENDDFIAK